MENNYGEKVIKGIPVPNSGTGLGPENASESNQPSPDKGDDNVDYGDLLHSVSWEDIRSAMG